MKAVSDKVEKKSWKKNDSGAAAYGAAVSEFWRQPEEPGPTVETAAEIDSDMPVARPLAEAIEMATSLMREHGLKGWRVKLDHARRRAGQCDYTNRVIFIVSALCPTCRHYPYS